MGRRTLGTLLAVAVVSVGCSLDVGAPPSVAEQVAATQPQDRKDDATPDADTTGADTTDADQDEETAGVGVDDGRRARDPEADGLLEFPMVDAGEGIVTTQALEAACAELLLSFGTEPIAPDDDAFVDVARTWRQLSLPLAEHATEAAAVNPFLEPFAEATREGSATMRAMHIAAEEGDLEAVEEALRAYRSIGSRIETEAEEHGLTGCL